MKRVSFVPTKLLAGSLLASGLLLMPVPALARDAASPARVLFSEGRDLVAAGDYAAACPKFEESLRLELGVGTQYHLADCWEHLGRSASAHALFLGAAASAKAAREAEREQVLRERAAALEPRLVRLVIEAGDPDPRLVIKRDDLPLEQETWGKAVAVDPGTYVIVAKAPGKKAWQRTLKIEASSKIVTVEVPTLEASEPKPASQAKPASVAPARRKQLPPPAPEPSRNDRGRSSPNYKALALGGGGLAALAVGTFFGFSYKSANDDAKAICPSSTGCSVRDIEDHDRLVDEATTARAWAYLGVGAGVAALGGALALYVFDKPEASDAAGIRALPTLGASGELGASVMGSF